MQILWNNDENRSKIKKVQKFKKDFINKTLIS